MGSFPNGSAPLQACARQIFIFIPPGRTGKAQVRLAAAGRLRSAVALELASGKVWALPIAVQPARGTRCSKGTGHPEWVRRHGPRAGAESHHACGREELLRCWADSEIPSPRGQWPMPRAACVLEPGPHPWQDGEAGPRAGLCRPGQPRRQPDASRSMVLAVPSLRWARVHWKGKPDPLGPDAGQ